MTIFQSAVLGLVQGLGEFLPISSSAHLIITPWLFGWKDPGLGFDVALHWGTLVAVLVYFRRDFLQLIKAFFASLNKKTRDFKNNIYQKLSWLLIIATIPGAVLGKLLESKAEDAFRSPLLIAATMSLFGLLLWVVDKMSKHEKNLDRMTWKDSLIIGISQAAALVPGVSRSGATITAGRFLNLKRQDAARFSFLMSAPIIFGAGLAKIKEFHNGVTNMELAVGFLVSAIVGFLAIKFLLRLLAKTDFRIFIIYRFIFSLVILTVIYLK